MKKFLNTTRLYFLYALPAVLFFSYYPRFALGETDFMHLELSLPLIWLALFAIISIPSAIAQFKSFRAKPRLYKSMLFTVLAFILYLSISIFWSLNPLRTLLTAGIVWCLFIVVLSFNGFIFTTSLRQTLLKIFFISTFCICVFCWLQCILDIAGLKRPYTLLCLGCTYRTFGFPHPNGFAIEPQFMGNLLIAPTLTSLYLLVTEKAKPARLKLSLLLLFFTSTLFLTFSRGAIYAFCLGAALLLVLLIIKTQSMRPLKYLIVIVISFIATLCAQGIFATLSPTSDTFVTGVTKSIHQLSLGTIDLRPTVRKPTPDSQPLHQAAEQSTSTFDGYVEESTETRLDLTAAAFRLSTGSLPTFFFGVGLGGAGKALGSKEIIQNEYASLLLELGLLGLLLFIASVVFVVLLFIKKHPDGLVLILSVIFAYLLTIFFFSGLPNALHIYILPFLLYYLF